MARDTTITKFREVIFGDANELTLTDMERCQLLRIRAVYTLQLDNPTISNKEVVAMLGSEFGVTNISQAYRIIAQTHLLLGSVPNASKQWTRFMVVEALKGVMEKADAIIVATMDDDTVIKALEAKTKAADKLAKYARLDQADPEATPYEDIVNMKTEFVTDPSVVGVDIVDSRAMVERVKKKYIDFEELKNE